MDNLEGMKEIGVLACKICGYAPLKPHLALKRDKQILVCPSCTNAFTYPEPVANYDDHSFYNHVQRDSLRWRSYSQQIARFLGRSLSQRGYLLDVGCSHGLLLEEATKLGFLAEGIEPSRSAVEYCQKRGLRVRHGYLEDGVFSPRSFDVIVASHVVEHVAEPSQLLGIVYKLLKPTGTLCLVQTNYQGTLPRRFGKYWEYWGPNEHYFHSSLNGISTLLTKNNFQTLKTELVPLGYYLNFRFGGIRSVPAMMIRNTSFVASRWRIGFPFRGDQMYVLARLESGGGT